MSYSLLTTHYSLLTTHYSLLTTHYSLLTTHYSLLTTHYSLGVARFSGVLNGTVLHDLFVAAAEAGGAWVAYNWINAGDSEPYLKLAYVVKIFRDGRNFYLGVGLSDVPLVSSDLPCSSSYSAPCAENWALSIAGFRDMGLGFEPNAGISLET